MTNWGDDFDKRYFEQEPSNNEVVLKIKTGNGPFAYRNASRGEIKAFIRAVVKEERRKTLGELVEFKNDYHKRRNGLLSPSEQQYFHIDFSHEIVGKLNGMLADLERDSK